MPWAAGVFLAGVLLSYAGLIGLGQWSPDEYDDFASFAQNGWNAFWHRLQWSPRPFSETAFYAYGCLVNLLHRPLIASFLGVLWAGFFVAGLFTAWQMHREHRDEPLWPCLLVTLSFMASFVTGGGLTEVFYWPAGAVAYLTTLSVTLLLFLQVATGRLSNRGGRLLASFCLAIAASSSEAGAAFVLAFALVQVVQLILVRAGSAADQTNRLPVLWWMVPTLLSVLLIAVVGSNRYHVVEEPTILTAASVGHPLLSLLAASRKLLLEIVGWESYGRTQLSGRLLAEMLLAVGVGMSWRLFSSPRKKPPRQIAGLIATFLLASLFTLAAEYVHFGTAVGERHETIRRCWILMSAAGLGILGFSSPVMQRLRSRPFSNVLAPLLLCAAIFPVWHVKALLREYQIYVAVRHTTERNFQSGYSAGGAMTYDWPPFRGVLSPSQPEPGVYTSESPNAAYPLYILRYFNKQTLVVRKEQ